MLKNSELTNFVPNKAIGELQHGVESREESQKLKLLSKCQVDDIIMHGYNMFDRYY